MEGRRRVADSRCQASLRMTKAASSRSYQRWACKSPQVAEVLPLLYLPGLSSSDFGPALEHFLGSVTGLSVAIITRLTGGWHDEAEAFDQRSLSDTDYVYVWVDGIVRREALCNRVRVKGPRRLVVVATG